MMGKTQSGRGIEGLQGIFSSVPWCLRESRMLGVCLSGWVEGTHRARRSILAALVFAGSPAGGAVAEDFSNDPVASGRFEMRVGGTESGFEHDAAEGRLRAVLDVDRDAAFYLSRPFGAVTDGVDASFSVRFRVEEVDDRFSPAGFFGLMTDRSLGDFGDGLTMVVSTAEGRLVANATIEQGEFQSGGAAVPLELAREYLAVGRYKSGLRTLTVEILDGAGFTNLVGFSSALLPQGRSLSVNRIGLQNSGARNVDQEAGSLTVTVDDLFTPAAFPNRLAIGPVSVEEGNVGMRTALFPVTLVPASSVAVTVEYATSDITATAGVDYVAAAGTLVFPPGVGLVHIPVSVIGDVMDEDDETFRVTLSGAVDAVVSVGEAIGTIRDDDPTPTLSIQDVSVVEGDVGLVDAVFEVSLSAVSGRTVTARYATSDGTATAGSDYVARSGLLTLPAGERVGRVTVPVIGDVAIEADETFRVTLSGLTHAVPGRLEAVGTILDDDEWRVLEIGDVTLFEGAAGTTTNAVFRVGLSRPSSLAIKVEYLAVGGSATLGVDFRAASGSLIFEPGQTEREVVVVVIGDDLPEPDETFVVQLSDPVGARIGRSQGIGTIRNDDPYPAFSVFDTTVVEGSGGPGEAVFRVVLAPAAKEIVTVRYATSDGTARAGVDYGAVSGILEFPVGTTEREIRVPVMDDLLDEDDETFRVTLSEPTQALIQRGVATGTILDDDEPPEISIAGVSLDEGHSGPRNAVFPVSLSRPSGRRVSVGYATSDGTARTGDNDYQARVGRLTFEPGQTTGAVTVPVVGDRRYEFDETFFVTLSQPENGRIGAGAGRATGEIRNDDDPPRLTIGDVRVVEGHTGTRDAVFTVGLTEASGRPVTVSYETADGTARAGNDYIAASGTLSFSPGETSKPVTVKVIGDRVAEPDETFLVSLRNPSEAGLQRERAVGTIEDDDVCEISIEDVTVTEGDSGTTQAVFRVSLSVANSRTVTVRYATADGTATAGEDYEARSGELEFAPGTTVGTVVVPVIGDCRVEADERFYVDLSGAVNAGVARARGTGTIRDDDSGQLFIDDVTVIEGPAGTTTPAVFTVRLSAASCETVTVRYETADGTATEGEDYRRATGLLTFPAGTVALPVTVTVLGDDIPEPNEMFFVRLSDPVRATLGRQQGIGTIVDDDLVVVVVPVRTSVIVEDCLPANGAIDPGETVTVNFALANVGSIPTTNLIGRLVEGGGVTPISGPQPFGRLEARGPEVSRPFTLRVDGECGGVVEARMELREGTVPLTNVVFRLTLGTLVGGRWVCCRTADVGVAVPGVPETVEVGQPLTYVAEVANRGPLPATAVGLTNRIPAGVRLISFEATQGGCELEGDLLRCALGRIEPGEGAQVIVVGVPESPGDRIAIFRVGSVENDPNPNDNVAVVATRVLAPTGLSIGDVAVREGDTGTTNAVFTVWLQPGSGRTVTVDYETADGTAMAGVDYVRTQGPLTFAPGTTTATVMVPVLGDRLVEADETFRVVLRDPVNAVIAEGRGIGTGTILDDDVPALTVEDVTVEEPPDGGRTEAVFPLRLEVPIGRRVSVAYATANGTAIAGLDYEATSGVLMIEAGQTEAQIRVGVLGDTVTEPDETFHLVLSRPENATLSRTNATGTILDFDGIVPSITIDDVRVVEGRSGTTTQAVFTVRLTVPSRRAVGVTYTTANGTAVAGSDYVLTSGQLEWAPGTTEQRIAVTVHGDDLPELDEIFHVRLSDPVNAVLAVSQGTGTIVNDDYLGRPEAAGWALMAEECVPANGAVDPGETVTLQLALVNRGLGPIGNLTARLRDTGRVTVLSGAQSYGGVGVGGGAVSRPFTLQAMGGCGERLTLWLEVADGDRSLGALPYELVLGRESGGQWTCCTQADLRLTGNGTPEPVTLGGLLTYALVLENLGPGEAERVQVLHRLPDGVPLVAATSPAGEVTVTNRDVVVSIPLLRAGESVAMALEVEPVRLGNLIYLGQVQSGTADPVPGNNLVVIANRVDPPPGLSINDVTVTEGPGARAVFTVRLHPPSGREVTVDYATLDGTAVAGRDYVPASGTLRFPSGTTELRLSIEVLDDAEDEPTEFFQVQLSRSEGAAVARGRGTATILDDDPPGLSIGDVEVNVGREGAAVAILEVTLSSPGERDVRVRYATRDGTASSGTDYETRAGVVEMPAGETRGRVEVVVSGNTFDEGIEWFFVDLSEPEHASLIRPVGRVTITDEDPGVVSIADARVLEGDHGTTNAVFEVRLTAPNRFTVRADYSTADGTARAGEDYLARAGAVLFEPGEVLRTVSVPVLGDRVYEHDETFEVRLSEVRNARFGRDRAVGTIVNDDPMPTLEVADVRVPEGDEGTTVAAFGVALSNPSSFPVSVRYRTGNGSALAGLDYRAAAGTLRFEPLRTTATLPVEIIGDRLDEPDETFHVELLEWEGAMPGRVQAVGTIVDDDPPPELSVDSVSVIEGDEGMTDAVFSVRLSGPSGFEVTVDYATADLPPGPTSATAGLDYRATSGTLRFRPGETGAQIRVEVLGDTLEEEDERFEVRLVRASHATFRIDRGLGTIVDDDRTGGGGTECPRFLTVVAPRDRACYAPGSTLHLAATPGDGDADRIERVEFHVGSMPLAVVRSSPFAVDWEEVPVGDYCFTAVAYCRDGAMTVSEPVCVVVRPLAGDVAIVGNGEGSEIELMEAYLWDMGLCPVVFDEATADFEALRPFRLVIWNDLGEPGLTGVQAELFARLHAEGMPLYLIGERLGSSGEALTGSARVAWQSLVQAGPVQGRTGAGRIILDSSVEYEAIRHGHFGVLEEWIEHPGGLEVVTNVDPESETLGRAGESEVLVIHPGFQEVDYGQTRTVRQHFLVARGDDPAGQFNRKALFQNAVCWLIRCLECGALSLAVEMDGPSGVVRAGDEIAYTVTVRHGGECEGVGVVVTHELPPNVEFLHAEYRQGRLEWRGGTLVFHMGHLARSSVNEIRVIGRVSRPGLATSQVSVRGNNEYFDETNLARWEVEVGGIELLVTRDVGGGMRLGVRGPVGWRYLIERAEALIGEGSPWRTVGEFRSEVETTWIPIVAEPGTAAGFYRARHVTGGGE
ncbi:MAG: DUF11 domain-containing protein [Verrucomicrobiae bacterium]|nr:DUF11 domain-containing protein [Verrucomicrobiae bacterium]